MRLFRFRIVIHALEQYGLVSQRNPGMCHPMTGFVKFFGAFLRMIYVNTDPSVVMRPKGIYQALGNPLRKKNRNS